jgi:hypothetical protein
MKLKKALEEIKFSKLTIQRLKQESVILTSQLTQTGRNNPRHETDNYHKNSGRMEVNYKPKEPVVRKGKLANVKVHPHCTPLISWKEELMVKYMKTPAGIKTL